MEPRSQYCSVEASHVPRRMEADPSCQGTSVTVQQSGPYRVSAGWSPPAAASFRPSLGASPCTLAVFFGLAFPEGGLLVGTPACCTGPVAGLLCVLPCWQLPAAAVLTWVSLGMPLAFMSPGMWGPDCRGAQHTGQSGVWVCSHTGEGSWGPAVSSVRSAHQQASETDTERQ